MRSVIIHGGISPPYFQQIPPPPRAAAAGVCVGVKYCLLTAVWRDLLFFFIAANAYILFLRAAVRKSTISRFIPSRIRVQTCTGREDGMDFFCSSGETRPTLTTRLSAVISERKPPLFLFFFSVCMTTHAHPFSYNPVKAAPPPPSAEQLHIHPLKKKQL